MKIKKSDIIVSNKQSNKNIIEVSANTIGAFKDLGIAIKKYESGLDSMAEFCGKIDALRIMGLSSMDAIEVIFALKAIDGELNNQDNKTNNKIV